MNMWKRLSPVKKEIFLLLIMAGFGLVKQFLVYNLPIMAVPKGIHDDWIMVHHRKLVLRLPSSVRLGPSSLGISDVDHFSECSF